MNRKCSVVTIGVFDGIHRGHAAVLRKVAQTAEKKGLQSIAVTFDPHPLKILYGKHSASSLISLKHRVRLIRELGIGRVFIVKFNKKIANMPPEKFIRDIIIRLLRAKEIFVGEDFCFGKGAGADAAKLRFIGKRLGIKVSVVRHVKKRGRIISSSLIRDLVKTGRIDEVPVLLGRPYSILGTVVSGSKLARSLGYPTANINPHHEAIPTSGVYAVKVKFMGKFYKGVMNIGTRPTFYNHGKDKEPSLEVHIFDFDKRIYGTDLEVIFVKKLRDEKRFKTMESLIEQIKRDEIQARKVLSSFPSNKRQRRCFGG